MMKHMKNKWSLKKEEEEETTDPNKFNEWVNKKETKINKELFKNYFSFQTLSALLKELYKTNDKEKKRLLVSVINSGLTLICINWVSGDPRTIFLVTSFT